MKPSNARLQRRAQPVRWKALSGTSYVRPDHRPIVFPFRRQIIRVEATFPITGGMCAVSDTCKPDLFPGSDPIAGCLARFGGGTSAASFSTNSRNSKMTWLVPSRQRRPRRYSNLPSGRRSRKCRRDILDSWVSRFSSAWFARIDSTWRYPPVDRTRPSTLHLIVESR